MFECFVLGAARVARPKKNNFPNHYSLVDVALACLMFVGDARVSRATNKSYHIIILGLFEIVLNILKFSTPAYDSIFWGGCILFRHFHGRNLETKLINSRTREKFKFSQLNYETPSGLCVKA